MSWNSLGHPNREPFSLAAISSCGETVALTRKLAWTSTFHVPKSLCLVESCLNNVASSTTPKM
ncbi:hypothetical protein ACTXT7_009818 [Hymenolepis weldensis]